ncbi:hypothetical protein [Methanoculleus sp.]|uniref:hypothetical protein n=1 Tax=Methanoculleus sp. TaxID=90427 RepID=UPI0025CBDBF6|nr:hypothetical protein [Methanoculleus sp.]
MRENIRRPLLFLITVGTGSLIIIVDASIEVIVAGTVLAGFLALVVTGALNLAELRPSRLRSALREGRKEKASVEVSETKKPDATAQKPSLVQKLAATEINLPGMLGTFVASIRETITHARAPEGEKQRRIAKVDAMLDQAVDGTVPEQAAKDTGGTVDPLASLADLDFDSLEDLDLDGESSGPGMAFESDGLSLLSGEEADAVSEILKTHQDDLDDLNLTAGIDFSGDAGDDSRHDGPPATLPSIAADAPGLPEGEKPDMSLLLDEDLSALDGLDLDEIQIEGEEHEEADAKEPVLDETILEELEEKPEEDFDMVSFASGGAVDDDLIAELKSEVKQKKFVEDISLVRELKGEKYLAKDLAAELEDVLVAMKS